MRVAITGGIGEGKSTVLKMLAEKGYRTESADALARSIFLDPEVNGFLAEVAGVAGPVSPEVLRAAILADPHKRNQVNRIMHPRVIAAIESSDAIFFEVPLLIETCLHGKFDEVWVVTCGRVEQVRRLAERYGDIQVAEAAIATQLPSSTKVPFADVIVRTNEPIDLVRIHVSDEAVRAASL